MRAVVKAALGSSLAQSSYHSILLACPGFNVPHRLPVPLHIQRGAECVPDGGK
jgi:hypothetical protein